MGKNNSDYISMSDISDLLQKKLPSQPVMEYELEDISDLFRKLSFKIHEGQTTKNSTWNPMPILNRKGIKGQNTYCNLDSTNNLNDLVNSLNNKTIQTSTRFQIRHKKVFKNYN